MFGERPLSVSSLLKSGLPAFRAEHFPYSGPYPWLDRPDAAERIDQKLSRGELTAEEATQCQHWSNQGYVILKDLIEEPVIDSVWESYEHAIANGKIRLKPEPAAEDDPHPGRFLNPHRKAGDFCRILKHEALARWIRILMERDPKPLQTIASHKGSQQGVHSDSIHMTTYPLGYLTAAWIAFEDIHPIADRSFITPAVTGYRMCLAMMSASRSRILSRKATVLIMSATSRTSGN